MVHQYQLNGYNIVLDTCSGSVHVVDDVAYDVIAMYQDHTADQIVSAMMDKYGSRPDVTEEDLRQCIDDVTSLKEAGKLWSPDVYENMAFDFKNRSTVVKALCLHVAHTCNLSCSYCFASQGRYHGDRALMSFEVGKRAMDFLIENSVDVLYCIGLCCDYMADAAKKAGMKEVYYLETQEEFWEKGLPTLKEGDTILLKASRSREFEKTVAKLQGVN